MLRYLHFVVAAVVMTTTATYAKSFQVGTCLQSLLSFSKIQQAVSTVPAGSTIFVCPGIYPEQVTISRPLTLRGISFNGLDRATIVPPGADPAFGGGLTANVTSILGYKFAAQVLIQNVNPVGSVTIINMTIDGSGSGLSCQGASVGVNLAGIFFASGASGSIQALALRNQNDSGCGNGIWLENGSAAPQTITVLNNSVHDFDDAGIAAFSNQNPPTLTVDISRNDVHSSNNFTDAGIIANTVTGIITQNVITGSGIGILDTDTFGYQAGGVVMANNDIAKANTGIAIREGSTAKSNKISNTNVAFYLLGGTLANPGPTLLANTIKNTSTAVEYNCTVNVALKSNTINDAGVAFDAVPTNLTITKAVNPLYNVDAIESSACQ